VQFSGKSWLGGCLQYCGGAGWFENGRADLFHHLGWAIWCTRMVAARLVVGIMVGRGGVGTGLGILFIVQ